MTIRVVIADDQQLVRTGLRMILERQPDIDVVGEANDGREAIRVTESAEVDVVLMDIRMPGLDGIEATRHIVRGRASAVHVVILTTFDLDEYVFDVLQAGASGFLLKDAPPEQLISAIRLVAAGDAMLAPAITRRLIEQFVTPADNRTERRLRCAQPTRKSRCSNSSLVDCRIARSPSKSSSARRRSRRTSRGSSQSSTYATGCKPSCSPTKQASSPRAPAPTRARMLDCRPCAVCNLDASTMAALSAQAAAVAWSCVA